MHPISPLFLRHMGPPPNGSEPISPNYRTNLLTGGSIFFFGFQFDFCATNLFGHFTTQLEFRFAFFDYATFPVEEFLLCFFDAFNFMNDFVCFGWFYYFTDDTSFTRNSRR